MLKALRAKLDSDRGDSTLVSTILVIPLILGILITMIDVSVYFSNRSQVMNMSRDAVRIVSIYGGNGTDTQATPLEAAYGISRATACSGAPQSSPIVNQAYNNADMTLTTSRQNSTAVECQLMKTIATSSTLISVEIQRVTCGPQKSTQIGSQVYCVVEWKYNSIPGSALGFLQRAKDMYQADGLDGVQTIRVNSTSEVNLATVNLVNR